MTRTDRSLKQQNFLELHVIFLSSPQGICYLQPDRKDFYCHSPAEVECQERFPSGIFRVNCLTIATLPHYYIARPQSLCLDKAIQYQSRVHLDSALVCAFDISDRRLRH